MHRVLITGAASGLGAACAARLAREGHDVVLCDRDEERCRAVGASLALPPDRAIAMDVSSEDQVATGFAAAEACLAGPLSALVCCAGGSRNTPDHCPSLADTPLDDWIWTEAVNARGTFLCVREMLRLRRLVPVENGRIVVTASTAAHRPAVASGAAYSASKAAVIALMRSAALEGAAYGLTVNAIAPGPFDTPAFQAVTPSDVAARQAEASLLKRIGRPEEFAGLVVYLLGPDAAYVDGATIDINGGVRMA